MAKADSSASAGAARAKWKKAIIATMLSSVPAAAAARRKKQAETMEKLRALEEAESDRRHELLLAEQWEIEKEQRKAEQARTEVDDLRAQLRVETNPVKREHLQSELEQKVKGTVQAAGLMSELAEKARAREETRAVEAHLPAGAAGTAKSKWKKAIVATIFTSVPAAVEARRQKQAEMMAKLQDLEDAETDRRQELLLAEQWEAEKKRRASESISKCQEDVRSGGLLGEIGEKARARQGREQETAQKKMLASSVAAAAVQRASVMLASDAKANMLNKLKEIEDTETERIRELLLAEQWQVEAERRKRQDEQNAVLDHLHSQLRDTLNPAMRKRLQTEIEVTIRAKVTEQAHLEGVKANLVGMMDELQAKARRREADMKEKKERMSIVSTVIAHAAKTAESRKSVQGEKLQRVLSELDEADQKKLRDMVEFQREIEGEEKRRTMRARRSLLNSIIDARSSARDGMDAEEEARVKASALKRQLLSHVEDKAQELQIHLAEKEATKEKASGVLLDVMEKAKAREEEVLAKEDIKAKKVDVLSDLCNAVSSRTSQGEEKMNAQLAALDSAEWDRLQEVLTALHWVEEEERQKQLRKRRSLLCDIEKMALEQEEPETQAEAKIVQRSLLNEIEEKAHAMKIEAAEKANTLKRKHSVLADIIEKANRLEEEKISKEETKRRNSSVLADLSEKLKAREDEQKEKKETAEKKASVLAALQKGVSCDGGRLRKLEALEEAHAKRLQDLVTAQHDMDEEIRRKVARNRRSVLNDIATKVRSKCDSVDPEEEEQLRQKAHKRSHLSEIEEKALEIEKSQAEKQRTVKRASSVLSEILKVGKVRVEEQAARIETQEKMSVALSELAGKVSARRASVDDDKLLQMLQDMEEIRQAKLDSLTHEVEIHARRSSVRAERDTLNLIDKEKLQDIEDLEVEEITTIKQVISRRSLLSNLEERAMALQSERLAREKARQQMPSVLSSVIEKAKALDEQRCEKEQTKSKASDVLADVLKKAKEREDAFKVKEITRARTSLLLLEFVDTANDRQGMRVRDNLMRKLQELDDADSARVHQVVEAQAHFEEEERRKTLRVRRSMLSDIELKVRSTSEGDDPETAKVAKSKATTRSLLSEIEEKAKEVEKDRLVREHTKMKHSSVLAGVVSAAKEWEDAQCAKDETRRNKQALLSAVVEKAASLQDTQSKEKLNSLLKQLDDADWERVLELARMQYDEEEAARKKIKQVRRSLLNQIEAKERSASDIVEETEEKQRTLNSAKRSLLNGIEEKAVEFEKMKAAKEEIKARKSSLLSDVLCAVKEREDAQTMKQEIQAQKTIVLSEAMNKMLAIGGQRAEKKETMERMTGVLSTLLTKSASVRTQQAEDKLKQRLDELDEADRERVHMVLQAQHEYEEKERRKVLQARRSLLNHIDVKLRTTSECDDIEHHHMKLKAQKRSLLNSIEEKALEMEREKALKEQAKAIQSNVLSEIASAAEARDVEQRAKEETMTRKTNVLSEVVDKANVSREARDEKLHALLQELDDAHSARLRNLLHLQEEEAELKRQQTIRSRRSMLNEIEHRCRSKSEGDDGDAQNRNSNAVKRSLLTEIEEKALAREREQTFKELVKTRKLSLLSEVVKKANAREEDQDKKEETRSLTKIMLSNLQDGLRARDSFVREKRETREKHAQLMQAFRVKSSSLLTDEDTLRLKLQELEESEKKRVHDALLAQHEHELHEKKAVIRARRTLLNDIDLKQRIKTEGHDEDDHKQAQSNAQRRSLMTNIEEAAQEMQAHQLAKKKTEEKKSSLLSSVVDAAKAWDEAQSAKEETKKRHSGVLSEVADKAAVLQEARDAEKFAAWMQELEDAKWERILRLLQVQRDEEEKQRMHARRSMRRLLNEIEVKGQKDGDVDEQEDQDRPISTQTKRSLLSDIEDKAQAREKEQAFKDSMKARKSSVLSDAMGKAKLREEETKKKEETRERKSVLLSQLQDGVKAAEEDRRERKETREKRASLNESFMRSKVALRTQESEEKLKLRLQELDALDQKRVHDALHAHYEHEERERRKIIQARRSLLNHIDLKLGSKSDIEEEDRKTVEAKAHKRSLLTDVEAKANAIEKARVAKEETKAKKSSILSDVTAAAKVREEMQIAKEQTKTRSSSLLSELVEKTTTSLESRDEEKLKILLQELDDQHAKRMEALLRQQEEEEDFQRRMTLRSKRRVLDDIEKKGRSLSDTDDVEEKVKPARSLLSDIEDKALHRQKERAHREFVRARTSDVLSSVLEKAKAREEELRKKEEIRERKSSLLTQIPTEAKKKEEHHREKKETLERKSSVLKDITKRGELMQKDPHEALIFNLKVNEKMKEHSVVDQKRLAGHVQTQQEIEEEERRKTIQARRSVLSGVEKRRSEDDFHDSEEEARHKLKAPKRSLVSELEQKALQRVGEQLEKEKTKERKSSLLSGLGEAVKAKESEAKAKSEAKARMSGSLTEIVSSSSQRDFSTEAFKIRMQELEDLNQQRVKMLAEAQHEQEENERRKTIQARRSLLNSVSSRARAASDPELEMKIKADAFKRDLLNGIEKKAAERDVEQQRKKVIRRMQSSVLDDLGSAVRLRNEAQEHKEMIKSRKSSVLADIAKKTSSAEGAESAQQGA
eukprot:TRINITY_DN6303_c1_g1_i3.p1 TRINITY_DN6303_c1_g1~~TRINITY_DN6303_c1_g1_i3.p1  ORF type:complete len:2642 (-),score=747.95 TRINITY_DN6303_c1_g1_i3:33-7904(-)